jgi:hypothetical protein
MIMQLEFAVTVANTNANAAKHCPNRKNIFFMYTPLSISAKIKLSQLREK